MIRGKLFMPEDKNSIIKRIRDVCEKKRKEFIEIFTKFIETPSISAWKEPETLYKIVEKAKTLLKSCAVSTIIHDEYDSNYPLLTGETNSSEATKSKKIFFLGHLDVQPPGEIEKWTKLSDPFKPLQKEGKLYGRGSLDTKSQISAQIIALKILNELKIKIKALDFLYTTDEEIGSLKSTLKFFEKLSKNKFDTNDYHGAINGENTNERIVLGCKGIIKLKFIAKNPLGRMHSGKSMFHAYHPIINLAEFLSKIRNENKILIEKLNLLNPKIRIIKDKDLVNKKYENTNEILLSENGLKLAVGSKLWDDFISAGWSTEQIGEKFASISFNPDNFLSGSKESQTIVPDEAISEVDIRIPPKIAPTKIIEILKQITDQFPYITMEIIMPNSSDINKYFQGAFTSPANPFVQKFYQNCMFVYDQPRIFMPFSSGTSDDRFIEVLGLPHVKFGATGQNNHGYDEWVDLSSFFRVIQVYTLMMADLELDQ